MTDTSPAPNRTRTRRRPARSQPVLWWQLINEMEAYTAATGWGLAATWGHMHSGDYAAARHSLDELKACAASAQAADDQ